MTQIAANQVATVAREPDPAADRDRAPVGPVGAEEAGGDRGEHEDRLEALAEDQDRAVDARRVVRLM